MRITVETVEFYSEGSVVEADLFLPEGLDVKDRRPGILILGGFSSIRARLGSDYAQRFAAAGYPTLTFDYRGFGGSEGVPGRIIQYEQLLDIANALTWLEFHRNVAADQLAVWGVSNGGAHALSIAALDDRVKVVVGQNGYVDGRKLVIDRPNGPDPDKFAARLREDRRRRVFEGHGDAVPATEILDSPDTRRYVAAVVERFPQFGLPVHLEAAEDLLRYRPLDTLHLIGPKPILMIAAEHDDLTPADEYKKAYDLLVGPKRWECFPIHHYEMYTGEWFEKSTELAVDWFREHLPISPNGRTMAPDAKGM